MKPFQSLPGRANYLIILVWNSPDQFIMLTKLSGNIRFGSFFHRACEQIFS